MLTISIPQVVLRGETWLQPATLSDASPPASTVSFSSHLPPSTAHLRCTRDGTVEVPRVSPEERCGRDTSQYSLKRTDPVLLRVARVVVRDRRCGLHLRRSRR